ncbi:uncharacterized protein LOC129974834 [Argiope bruennichi]|uniref:uncharacterized protein LOC129974834 n=1 Tax=Argiope bruennichi TaxID=94029 RepID=UPI002494AA25|nr:uncharacterized protein LOC129974834 [Argiope bruennichi]
MEMEHSTCSGLFWGAMCIAILLLGSPPPSSADTSELGRYFRSVKSPAFQNETAYSNGGRRNNVIVQQGITMPFCNMFGCEMGVTQQQHKCDPGYKWDASFNRCRQIL